MPEVTSTFPGPLHDLPLYETRTSVEYCKNNKLFYKAKVNVEGFIFAPIFGIDLIFLNRLNLDRDSSKVVGRGGGRRQKIS